MNNNVLRIYVQMSIKCILIHCFLTYRGVNGRQRGRRTSKVHNAEYVKSQFIKVFNLHVHGLLKYVNDTIRSQNVARAHLQSLFFVLTY